MSICVDLHDVEYGECIVLDSGREILMVDCGSSNRVIRGGNISFFDSVRLQIMPRYRDAEERSFLLTHCHRDHLSGLWRILRADPAYFDRLFLPVSPCGEDGRPLLLEFALYVYAFLSRMTEYSHMNTGVLRLFHRAAREAGAQRVYPIRAGDSFSFCGTDYDILWPPDDDFPFRDDFAAAVDAQDELLSSPYLPSVAGDFLRLKRGFCSAYASCCRNSPILPEYAAETGALLRQIGALAPMLRLLPCADEICENLISPANQRRYSDALNASSVVFQNRRDGGAESLDILMTGDAPPETLAAVESNLYDGYFIVKAPHHGTKSAYAPLLEEIAADHILISNGVTGGKIAEEYAALPGIKHCSSNSVCAHFQSAGSCCNRLSVCHDMPRPGLAVNCAGNRSAANAGFGFFLGNRLLDISHSAPFCCIRVISAGCEKTCFCDIGKKT
ncbi:MAG TPA: hypothetical protein VHP31_10650 [Caproicibacter sp.]|nr:hypothetical protein [Caproicibacter sp.]